MLDLLTVFASTEGESSQTLFYILGGLAAVYGVVIAAIGITRPEFPQGSGQARAVFATSSLVVLLAMTSAVVTS